MLMAHIRFRKERPIVRLANKMAVFVKLLSFIYLRFLLSTLGMMYGSRLIPLAMWEKVFLNIPENTG